MVDDRNVLTGKNALHAVIVICVLSYLTTFEYDSFSLGAIVHVAGWVALCSLCGFWVGLGSFVWRFPIVVTIAISTAFFSNDFKTVGLSQYMLFAFGLVFVIGGTSYSLRLLFGELRKPANAVTEIEALQFNVRDMLIWTTSIAGTLALVRWLAANQGEPGLEPFLSVCGLLGTLVITNVAAIWAFLGSRLSVGRIIAFVVILAIASLLNNAIVSKNGFWLFATPVSQIPIVAAIYSLRKQNYRFVRSATNVC